MRDVLCPSSIALLDHAVAILKENGGDISLGLSKLLQFVIPKSDPSASSIAQVKKALGNAEELQEALEAVLVVAKSVVLNLSKEFSAITTQVGLDLIPDDILSIIFEYAHDTEDSLVAETLSHVNHRFRKVVLRMPKLWTYISSKRDSPSRAAELLTRSVPHLLSVLIEGRSNLHKFDEQSKEEQKEETTLEIAYDKFSSEEETLPDSVQFCVNWEMPSLSTLKARNFIPTFRKQVVSRLKSCLLELDYNSGFYDGGGWDMYKVTRFIGSLANLEELEFILPFQLFPPSNSASSFKLHNLQRLSLVFGLKGVTSCTNFFEVFECPNVLNVALDVVLPTGASVCSLLGCFQDVRGVEDLTLSMRHEPNRELEGPESFFDFELQDIAKKELFNKTKNLRVNYAMSRDMNEGFFDFSQKIRSVRIEDCEGDVNNLLDMLAERTNSFKGNINAEDGTCLLINPIVLEEWERRNGGLGSIMWFM